MYCATSQDVPSTKGFSSQLAGPESATRTFDGMTLIEFAGCSPSTRIMLPVKGKGMACGFQATPMVSGLVLVDAILCAALCLCHCAACERGRHGVRLPNNADGA